MLPRCRTAGEPFVIPTFDVQVSDVEGFMDELQAFQSVFHDCFARSEARAHCLDYMVGQYSPLARKSSEPIALAVEGSSIRSLQRFLSETVWDEEQMRWNYHQLVADERLCRKFCLGGREGAVAPVGGGIKRPGSRTVRPQ
jgi:DDE superfamily endonuclease